MKSEDVSDVRSRLFLGRALYDAERTEETRVAMAKGIHVVPNDMRLQFNAAACMQKSATQTIARMQKVKVFMPEDEGAIHRAVSTLVKVTLTRTLTRTRTRTRTLTLTLTS